MTRIAFITDIHADVRTLCEALRQIERMGCDLIVCGGDLVDIGWYPEETIGVIRSKKIACIRGNHDRWLLERMRIPARRRKELEEWSPSPDAMRFLDALPTTWNVTVEGVRVTVHHGTPRSDMDGIYPDLAKGSDLRRWLDQATADVLLVGHTHIPFALSLPGRGMVANPGALLRDIEVQPLIYDQPSEKFVQGATSEGATFGILELPSLRFTVHRGSDGTEVEITRRILF